MLLAAYVLAGVALVPFHGDESTLLYMSRDYAYLFLDHDLNRVLYSDNPVSPTEQHLRLLNGTLPKYLFGLAWHGAGFTPADLNEQWDWSADWNYNQQTGHAPRPELLLTARWVSALLLAAGVVPMFALGWQLGGARVAYLASLYYALSPALLLNGRRAMMEGSVTLFSLLVVLAGVWVLRPLPSNLGRGSARGGWKQLLATTVLGLTAGLALVSKHTALYTVAAVFGAGGGYWCWVWLRQGFKPLAAGKPSPLKGLVMLAFSGFVGVMVFLALNPAWWRAPLTVPGVVLQLRADLLQTQVNVFGGYSGLLDQIGGFWRQVLVALPQYYEVPVWQRYIGDQIARYEASSWRGVSVGGSAVGAAVLAVMMMIGGWTLVRGRGNVAARLMVGAWALVVTPATLLLTPLEWQRYYLPVYPAVGLLAAVGVDEVIRRILNRHDAKNAKIIEMT
ncbi:MAG: phospholipid carrier-dependent glycosyltransferase [Chloroflexi bacterium]|nr:phospholipid carrier-dependent glycosyltransferase [Chloroflexota bacterium]